jgi:hypothetical protein
MDQDQDQGDRLPAPPAMLPYELREKLGIPDRCPGCGESFGISRDWDALLAAVNGHLNETGCRGSG